MPSRDHAAPWLWSWRDAVAVVVAPLVSLMVDQVEHLVANGIKATHVSSAQKNCAAVLAAVSQGTYELVYVTPERLEAGFMRVIEKPAHTVLFAIDEAHCITSWVDFRPSYARLSMLREAFPEVPIIALTATATPRVRAEIRRNLRLAPGDETLSVVASFDRPNLVCLRRGRYEPPCWTGLQRLPGIRKALRWGSCIIYCITTCLTEAIAAVAGPVQGRCTRTTESCRRVRGRAFIWLSSATNAVSLSPLLPLVWASTNRMWLRSPCIAAQFLAAYHQHVGRAGRDGERAKCLMLWQRSDYQKHLSLLGASSRQTAEGGDKLAMLNRMVLFATSSGCGDRRCWHTLLLVNLTVLHQRRAWTEMQPRHRHAAVTGVRAAPVT